MPEHAPQTRSPFESEDESDYFSFSARLRRAATAACAALELERAESEPVLQRETELQLPPLLEESENLQLPEGLVQHPLHVLDDVHWQPIKPQNLNVNLQSPRPTSAIRQPGAGQNSNYLPSRPNAIPTAAATSDQTSRMPTLGDILYSEPTSVRDKLSYKERVRLVWICVECADDYLGNKDTFWLKVTRMINAATGKNVSAQRIVQGSHRRYLLNKKSSTRLQPDTEMRRALTEWDKCVKRAAANSGGTTHLKYLANS